MALEKKQRCASCSGWAYPEGAYAQLRSASWLQKAGVHFLCNRCMKKWITAAERAITNRTAMPKDVVAELQKS